MKRQTISVPKITAILLAVLVYTFTGLVNVDATPINARSVTLSSSANGANNVTYSLDMAALPTSTTPVKSLGVRLCASLSGGCTTPSGFSSGSSTLVSQPSGLGAASGWTVNTADSGSLRVLNAANSTNPSGAVSVIWSGVTNPSTANMTFYAVITTYSDAGWTTPIDTGSIALSTSNQIQVSMQVNETLTFCAGTSITGANCGTIAGTVVNLGVGSSTSPVTGTSVLAASTNATDGYSVRYSGATLTSGTNTITPLTSNASSNPGSKQFGINTVANTTPLVGADVSTGSGAIGSAATNYNTSNSFRFNSGDVIATAGAATNANAFTVSYLANIDGFTPAGYYNTILTYTATANF
jgi:hypothetical protein